MPRNQDKRIRESHALQVRRPRRGPVATTPPTETSAIATRTIGRQRAGNHPELQAIDLRRPRAQLHSVDQEACRGRRPLDGVVMEIGRGIERQHRQLRELGRRDDCVTGGVVGAPV